MSETTGTERIIIVLLVISLLVSGYSVISISPIAKNTKDLADSIEGIGDVSDVIGDLSEDIDDLSTGIDAILTKLGEVVEPDEPDEPDVPDEPDEEVILNYPRGGIIITFDPHESYSVPTQECIVPVYETLLRYNPEEAGELMPCLAESWEISDNGYSYIFHLRRGVTFTDGSIFDAYDVLFSYDRAITLNEEEGFGPGWIINQIDISASSVIDAYTVNITLKHPYAPFIFAVASQWGALMVDKGLVQEHATAEDPWAHEYLKENMVGTGPYMLEEWVREDYVILVKNPDYWGGWEGPHVDKIFMPIITESAIRRLRLEEGSLDIGGLGLEDALGVEGTEGINVEVVQGLTNFMIFMNTKKAPLDNILVRQAMSYLYDYAGTIETIRQGIGTQARGPIPQALWGWDPDCPQFTMDVAKAEELIREAGYEPEDLELEFWFQGVESRRVAEVLQAKAAEIGVKINLHETTWAILCEAVRPGSGDVNDAHHFAGLYWWPDYADPIGFLETMYRGDVSSMNVDDYPFFNWGYYSNPELNVILDEFVRETDHSKHIELMHQAQRIVVEDAPAIFVFDTMNILTYRDWVKGYYFNPLYTGTTDFYNIYIEGRE